MTNLIRKGNTQYAGNFSNNLVAKGGCKGTTNRCTAAAGRYQSGGNGSVGDRGYVMDVVEGIGALGSPMRTYKASPNAPAKTMNIDSLPRGGNNFPKLSSRITKLTGKVLKGGAHKTKKYRKGSRSKTMLGKKDFTTKKKSKMYNEKRFRRLFGRRTGRAPVFSFAGGRGAKGYSHPKKNQKSRTHKGRQDFTTKRGNKYFDRKGRRSRHANKSNKKRKPYMKGGSGGLVPLEFSKLPRGETNTSIAAPDSNFYSIGRNPGEGGRLANPIPFKAEPLCPL